MSNSNENSPHSNEDSSRDEVMEQLKALGYIDSGAGSSIWQGVLAKIFGIKNKVKSFFKKRTGSRGFEDRED